LNRELILIEINRCFIFHKMPVSIRYQTWLVVILSIVILTAYSLYIQPWMLDDAFITFRYAENIVHGNGPVYNAGDRVEGYTSFLWMIILAAGTWAGLEPVILSKILGVIFAVGTVVLVAGAHRFIRSIDYRVSAGAAVMLGTTGVFLPWGVSGMESTLFAFLVTLAVLHYVSIGKSGDRTGLAMAGVLCALASLARPEGLLVTAILLGHRARRAIRNRNYSIVYMLMFFLLLFLPYFGWRYLYYGYLLPNTFYAKVGFSYLQVYRGLKYAFRFVVAAALICLPLVDPSALYASLKRYGSLKLLLFLAGTYSLYIVLVGGDSMPAMRFFTPLMPVFCLLSAMCIASVVRGRGLTLFVTAAVIQNLMMIGYFPITPIIKIDTVAERGKEAGLRLYRNADPKALLATNGAGALPYYSKLETIDMLGMTDEHIAHRRMPHMGAGIMGHEKGDGAYVLSRRPDYIDCGYDDPVKGKVPMFIGDFELFESPEFREKYVLRDYKMPSGRDFFIYERARSGPDDHPNSISKGAKSSEARQSED
jgi:arabinofuranosyltransferase